METWSKLLFPIMSYFSGMFFCSLSHLTGLITINGVFEVLRVRRGVLYVWIMCVCVCGRQEYMETGFRCRQDIFDSDSFHLCLLGLSGLAGRLSISFFLLAHLFLPSDISGEFFNQRWGYMCMRLRIARRLLIRVCLPFSLSLCTA